MLHRSLGWTHARRAALAVALAATLGATVPACHKSLVLLRTCGLGGNGTPPWDTFPFAGGCAGAIDFGTLALGVPATRILALHHAGYGEPLTIDSIALSGVSGNADAFTLTFFLGN